MANLYAGATARIYAFPDRRTAEAQRRAVAVRAEAAASTERVVVGAWYHEEAIREAGRLPKR